MLKTSDYNGYIQDTPVSHIAPRTSAFNLQRAPWEAYQFKDERAAALNAAAQTNAESVAAAKAAAQQDSMAVQIKYEPWTQDNNDVSHNLDYVNDQPADYAVEPIDLDAVQLKDDPWT